MNLISYVVVLYFTWKRDKTGKWDKLRIFDIRYSRWEGKNKLYHFLRGLELLLAWPNSQSGACAWVRGIGVGVGGWLEGNMEGRLLGVATWIVLHVEVLWSLSDSSSGSIQLGEKDGVPDLGLEHVLWVLHLLAKVTFLLPVHFGPLGDLGTSRMVSCCSFTKRSLPNIALESVS